MLLYLFLLNFPPISPRSPSAGIVPAAVLAFSTWWLTDRFLRADRSSPAILGFGREHRPFTRLALGFAAGFALTTLWFAIVTLVMGATWHYNSAFSGLALLLAVTFHFFNNAAEELVYRGYLFLRLSEAWGVTITLLVTSVAFALLHVQAGIPWQSVAATVFTSGLIFGAIFGRWRSLPLALGFHVATNFGQDVTGLRPGPSSLLAAYFPADAAQSTSTVLVAIAALNITVAMAIHFWPQNLRKNTGPRGP